MPTLTKPTAAPFVPDKGGLTALGKAAAHCRGCPLWKNATQTVFGAGGRKARLILVGEQPGDAEDRAGAPFVGPAGRLLNEALAEAGIDRSAAYVTNAVKHFKHEDRGKRRIHKSPNRLEIEACRPWLEAEIHEIEPALLVCLGATAAQAILGREFRVSRQRGEILSSELAPHVMATVHPSSLLRLPDPEARRAARAAFVADLRHAAAFLKKA